MRYALLALWVATGCAGLPEDAAGRQAEAPPSEEVAVVLSDACEGATCHHLQVSCEGLPARSLVVREFSGDGTRGTVVLTTGVFGIQRYDADPVRRSTIGALVEAGFQVFQIEWGGGRTGWITGAEGAGFSRALCGYAAVFRWILDQPARNPSVACAQGNSGGALQNGYGLALYGLERELDLVVFSGGPPVTRIEQFCFGKPRDSGAKESGRRFVERALGWDRAICQPGALGHEVLERARADSLVSDGADRDVEYPATAVHFVLSEGDRSRIEARRFFDAIESAKEWHWLPGNTHGIDATLEGASLIRDLFLEGCKSPRS